MADLRSVSLIADFRSEAALSLMPRRGRAPAEVLVIADHLELIDAWGAVALRAEIELATRVQHQRVTVSQPRDRRAWMTLYHLLAVDCPRQLVLANDSARPKGSRPASILLPTMRMTSLDRAEATAAQLTRLSAGRLSLPVRYLATQLPELALNALKHGASSPTAPVACCFYDRHEDELQLVVGDLGDTYDHGPPAGGEILDAVVEHPEGGLVSAVEGAAFRSIDVSLTLAAGTGRVYWRSGDWTTGTGESVAGFVAALAVHID